MNLVFGDVFLRVEDTSIFVMGQKDPLNLYGVVLTSVLRHCSLDAGSLSTLTLLGALLWGNSLRSAFHLVGATALCTSSKGVLKCWLLTQMKFIRNSGHTHFSYHWFVEALA
jgi:hypothetical protein